MKSQKEKFISRKEAMELLMIGPTTMSKYIKNRNIPFYRVGRRILLMESEILDAIRCIDEKNV